MEVNAASNYTAQDACEKGRAVSFVGVGLDAAFLTLRAVNPVANVVIGTAIGATLVIPAVFAKSKDHKWKKKMKKADKMIAAMEFAQGKQISDPSLDSYQGYNKESVDAIAESTTVGSPVLPIVDI